MNKLQTVASPMSTRIMGADGVLLPEIKSPLGVRSKIGKYTKGNKFDDQIQPYIQKLNSSNKRVKLSGKNKTNREDVIRVKNDDIKIARRPFSPSNDDDVAETTQMVHQASQSANMFDRSGFSPDSSMEQQYTGIKDIERLNLNLNLLIT